MIHELEKIDPASAKLFEELESAQVSLREIESSISDYAEDMEVDPKEFANLEARLSRKRDDAAPKLAKDIAGHLKDLGFKQSVFEVHLSPHSEPQRDGLEEVDFQLAPTPGEPLPPLRLTASS